MWKWFYSLLIVVMVMIKREFSLQTPLASDVWMNKHHRTINICACVLINLSLYLSLWSGFFLICRSLAHTLCSFYLTYIRCINSNEIYFMCDKIMYFMLRLVCHAHKSLVRHFILMTQMTHAHTRIQQDIVRIQSNRLRERKKEQEKRRKRVSFVSFRLNWDWLLLLVFQPHLTSLMCLQRYFGAQNYNAVNGIYFLAPF